MPVGIGNLMSTLRWIHSFPRRTLTLSGSEAARAFFRHATKPHPTYRIISNKTIGVGLIELPTSFEAFLKGSSMQALRTNRMRALNKGYTFEWSKTAEHRRDILEINNSFDLRQGRAMDGAYTNPEVLEGYLSKNEHMYGVFDADRRLRAYVVPIFCGEVCVVGRILGHGNHLNHGIMYLLISEIVRDLIESRCGVKYFMYDTFIGANPGLRYFKERSGFRPYWVKWHWRE